MSDPISFALELPDGGDALGHVARLLELAGSVPELLSVVVKTRSGQRVEFWQRLLSDTSRDEAGDDPVGVDGETLGAFAPVAGEVDDRLDARGEFVDGDDEEGKYVHGSVRADAAASIIEQAEEDAVELSWDVSYWKNGDLEPLTPGADNAIVLRINAREDLSFDEPGVVDLEITVNSHSSAPDVEDVADLVAAHAGLAVA